MSEIYIEKWLTFTLIDSRWDIRLWADSAKPVNAKMYRLRVKVPAELVGEIEVTKLKSERQVLGAKVSSIEHDNAYSEMVECKTKSEAFHKNDGETSPACD